uniref:Uncharacterized protein n=1 Tax=Opuntia streptacantha TaxID=393608 RepID=A0A7C8ZU27_OPUST
MALATVGAGLAELTGRVVASSWMEGSFRCSGLFFGAPSSFFRQASSSLIVFSSTSPALNFLHLALPFCTIFSISGSFQGPLSERIQPPLSRQVQVPPKNSGSSLGSITSSNLLWYLLPRTCILAVVFGSRKPLIVFHKSLKPEPALMINIRFRVSG